MKSTEMKRGQTAVVCSIKQSNGLERKVFEIGIMKGTEIKLLEKHPLRGPMVFQVGPARIVLGRDVASALDVELVKTKKDC